MSNYAQTTFFTPKDALPPSDPGKTIFGAAYDVEFGNIATAISSKFDSTSIAAAPVSFNIGTAALPGITFVGHTGTGLFSNANGDLGLSANGVQRLITSGTTGGLVIAAPTSAATALVINTIGSSAGIQMNLAGSAAIGIRLVDGGANNTVLDLNTNNTEANLKASGTSSQLSFFTAGTSRITITNAGGLFTNGATGGDQGSGTMLMELQLLLL